MAEQVEFAAGRKTIVSALHSALEPRFAEFVNACIQSLVARATVTRARAYALAAVVFGYLAQMTDAQILALEGLSASYRTTILEDCFHPTLFDHILACAYNSDVDDRDPPNVGAWLLGFRRECFGGLGLASVDQHPDNTDLVVFHSCTRVEIRDTMLIAFSNCFEYSTSSHMVSFLVHRYYLTGKEAKAVCAHIGTSLAGKRKAAKRIRIDTARALARKLQYEYETAEPGNDQVAKKAVYDASELALDHARRTEPTEEETDAAIAAKFPIVNVARHIHSRLPVGATVVNLPTLVTIVERERRVLRIQEKQTTMGLLRLRQSMLSRFPDREGVRRFTLVPVCSLRRLFIRITHRQILHLVPLGWYTVRARIRADADAVALVAEKKAARDAAIVAAADRARRLARRQVDRQVNSSPENADFVVCLAASDAAILAGAEFDADARDHAALDARIEASNAERVAADRKAAIFAAGDRAYNDYIITRCNAARQAVYEAAIAGGADDLNAEILGSLASADAWDEIRKDALLAGQAASHQAAIDACYAAALADAGAIAASLTVEDAVRALEAAIESAAMAADLEIQALNRRDLLRVEHADFIADHLAVAARLEAAVTTAFDADVVAINGMDFANADDRAAALAAAVDRKEVALANQQMVANEVRAALNIADRLVTTAARVHADADAAVADNRATVAAAKAAVARIDSRVQGAELALLQPRGDAATGANKDAEIAAAWSIIFKPGVIQNVQSVTWAMGVSFMTDGIQLQRNVVTRETKEVKTRQTTTAMATKQEKKLHINNNARMIDLGNSMQTFTDQRQGDEIDEDRYQRYAEFLDYVRDELELKLKYDFDANLKAKRKYANKQEADARPAVQLGASKATKFANEVASLPADAIFIGFDPGQRNVCGTDIRDPDNPDQSISFEYSRGSWFQDTGQQKRNVETLEALALERLNDDGSPSAFAHAEAAFDGANIKTTDMTVLVASVRTRLENFHVLHAFYGHPKRARVRFSNYIGEQEMLHTLVGWISPPETRKRVVLIVGDAINSAHAMKNSISPKLVRALKKAGVRCVECDEYRTSMLDCVRRVPMYHPPKKVIKQVNGQKVVRLISNYCVLQVSMPDYTRTCSRDKNAAKNIREKYEYMLRPDINGRIGRVPPAFVRGSDLPLHTADGTVRQYRYRLPPNRNHPGFVRR